MIIKIMCILTYLVNKHRTFVINVYKHRFRAFGKNGTLLCTLVYYFLLLIIVMLSKPK